MTVVSKVTGSSGGLGEGDDPKPPEQYDDLQVAQLLLRLVGAPAINLTESMVSGDISRTIEGASQLTFTIHDLAGKILKSGRLEDDKHRLRSVEVELDGYWFRGVKVGKAGPDLTLTLEDREVSLLRGKKGPVKAPRSKVTRAEFVRGLTRKVKRYRIRFVCPELHEVQPIGKPVTKKAKAKRDDDRAQGFPSGKTVKGKEGPINMANAERVFTEAEKHKASDRVLTALAMACIVEAPDFANPSGGDASSVGILQMLDIHGWTAAQRRDIERVVRKFLLDGFTGAGGAIDIARKSPNMSAGQIAQAVQGSKYPERYDQQRGPARELVELWGGAGGSSSSSKPTRKRYEFVIPREEDFWTGITRLAEEVRWRAFMDRGRLYFISEERLYKSRARMIISEQTPGVSNIDFDWDHRKRVGTMRVSCRIKRWQAPPGTVVIVEGMGPANGRWLVQTVGRPLFNPEGEITLKRPMEKAPEPAPEMTSGSGGGGGESAESGSLFAEAKKISDAGGPYVYGGSHGPALSSINSGAGQDCSSSTSLALFRAGMMEGKVAQVSGWFASSWGKAGRGKEFTVWANGGHVWIEFHGEHAGWRFDTSPHAGDSPSSRGPRLRKGTRSSAGFTPRHWEGH